MRLTAEQYNRLTDQQKQRLMLSATIDWRMEIVNAPFAEYEGQNFLTDPNYKAAARLAADYRFKS